MKIVATNMEYSKKYAELKNLFDQGKAVINIPGSEMKIYNINFSSDNSLDSYLNTEDLRIAENFSFSYPVFAPSRGNSKKAILLFHGLNERSWIKYLAWAYYLAETTNCFVILFPISFHINRSPLEWKDPRAMKKLMNETKAGEYSSFSSFANAALSNRLMEEPLRFFLSGYRTVVDILDLIKTIRKGRHPVIPSGVAFDIFGYSIGAFMAEILMLANPGNVFAGSKLFIFCGGSVFSAMHGASRLIMDKRAFDRVYNFYLEDFEKTITRKNPLYDFFSSSPLGMSFRAMIDFSRLRQFREDLLKKLQDQIFSIALQKDLVIPADGITATLNLPVAGKIAEVWDFGYAYSHENPFPVNVNGISGMDSCFEKVFTRAAEFLTK